MRMRPDVNRIFHVTQPFTQPNLLYRGHKPLSSPRTINAHTSTHITTHTIHPHPPPRSTARLSSGQRTALNDVEEAHVEDREGKTFYVYEHLAQVDNGGSLGCRDAWLWRRLGCVQALWREVLGKFFVC